VWVWVAATAALVVLAAVLWRGSDAAATTSTTAEPAGAPLGTPAGALAKEWSEPGDPVPEQVVESHRVLLAGEHGVRALEPLGGQEVWRYTRSNARLCDVAVTDGVAVAVFRTEDRCDEAVALDADTGVRAWTRNVGFAGDVVLEATDGIVLAVAEGSVVTLDPVNDNIRWRYEAPERCRILTAEAGDAGVALLQRCAGSSAVQLRLLDGMGGQARWSRDLPAAPGQDLRLLGADRVLGVGVGREVQLLDGDDGAVLETVPGGAGALMTSVGVAVLLLADGTVHAYDASSGARLWQAAALGLPAPAQLQKQGDGAGAVLLPEASGFVPRDALTGEQRGEPSAVAGLEPGGVATVVGPVVVHRLDDGVVVYR
jgi:outer membrane protein assembly factor BamB